MPGKDTQQGLSPALVDLRVCGGGVVCVRVSVLLLGLCGAHMAVYMDLA